MEPLQLGVVVATPAALREFERAGEDPAHYIYKHQHGDWGILSADDWLANERAVKDGSRILSSYTLSTAVKVWVISEACGEDGRRESTCVLLPSCY